MTSSLIKDVNSQNIFCPTRKEDFTSVSQEKVEKEKKFFEDQKLRDKELKQQEERRRQQEIRDSEALREEKKRLMKKNGGGLSHRVPSRGRGMLLAVEEDQLLPSRPRGRGRLSPQERGQLPLLERESNVLKTIEKHTESSFHNNKIQKYLWVGNQKDDIQERFYDTSGTLSASDQYEDADSGVSHTSESFITSYDNPTPTDWPVLPTSAAAEAAALEQPMPVSTSVPTSVPQRAKTRGSRLAAKFSNTIDIVEPNSSKEEARAANKSEEDYDDPLAVLGSSLAPLALSKHGRKTRGMSVNNLNSAQRVLSNNILRPEELAYGSRGSSNHFTLNMNDFPSL